MKKTYVATYVSGFKKLVPRILKTHYDDVRVLSSLDGLIVFSTAADPENLGYFNNVFLLLHQFRSRSRRPMNDMLTFVSRSKEAARVIAAQKPSSAMSFRIVTSRENKLVSVDSNLLKRAEQFVAATTGMRVDRSRPGVELWCLHRREGIGLFMMRLTKHATTTRMLHKGELRSELASLLCALSEPHDRDVFVDPFCGYGSIPLARARLAPYMTIHASDNDLDKINYLRKKLRTGATRYPSGSFQVNCGDALRRNTFRNDSVDKIVTDPPWGIFDDTQTVDIDRLYHDMLKECVRILKPGGILVILTAQKELLSHCVQHHRGTLGVSDTYHILVSGKKAVVYKLAKR